MREPVTLFADASFDTMHRASGWGGWLKSGRRQQLVGDVIGEDVTTCGQAEIWAVHRTINHGLLEGFIQLGDLVDVYTDSDATIASILFIVESARFEPGSSNWMLKPARRLSASLRACTALPAIKGLVEEHALQLVFHHVKGHVRWPREVIHQIHARTDQLARVHMQQQRADRVRKARRAAR